MTARSRFWKRLAVALAAVSLLTAGCGGSPSSSAQPTAEGSLPTVPWSQAVALADVREGQYVRTATITLADEEAVIQEWVTFDLGEGWIDRRIALDSDPQTGEPRNPTPEEPSLRFIYTDGRSFMWNPSAAASCGTSWVEMPPEEIERATGLAFPRDNHLWVEPLDILKAEPSGAPLHNREDGTIYEVRVPALTGVPMSSFLVENPGLLKELEEREQPAEVLVPRGDDPLEVTVDLGQTLEAVRPGMLAGGTATVTWRIDAPIDVTPPRLPADAARPHCLD